MECGNIVSHSISTQDGFFDGGPSDLSKEGTKHFLNSFSINASMKIFSMVIMF